MLKTFPGECTQHCWRAELPSCSLFAMGSTECAAPHRAAPPLAAGGAGRSPGRALPLRGGVRGVAGGAGVSAQEAGSVQAVGAGGSPCLGLSCRRSCHRLSVST